MAAPAGSWAWWKGVDELSQRCCAFVLCICGLWVNFQRKEGGEFMRNYRQISLATGSY